MSDSKQENEKAKYLDQMKGVANEEFKVSGWGYRHQQCLVLFLCLTIAYSMRACMGVSLVAMTMTGNHRDEAEDVNESSIVHTTSAKFAANEDVSSLGGENTMRQGFLNAFLLIPPYPKFTWNKRLQDTVTSSFFWGYMVLQIPGGQLAHRFGARRLLSGALMINCMVSFCLPWAAYYGGWISTMLCRLLQGLSQACIVPAMHTFFGKWAPLEERARLAGSTLGGQALGLVLGLPLAGFIASSPLGWPGIFRFFGLLSGLMAVMVFLMVSDTPAKHPKISAAERRYIEEGLGFKKGYEKVHLPIPWSRILRSRGVLAIVVAHIGQTWNQLTLYTEVPAFMDKVMGVNIKANGMLTALPFLVMWFANFFFNWFTDMLIVKKICSPTNARKVANSLAICILATIGHFLVWDLLKFRLGCQKRSCNLFLSILGCIPASIGLVILAFAPKNIYVVESLLVIICAFKISCHVGFMVNHIDLAPNFAGTLMSLSNFMSNLTGSQAPLVAGFILTDVTSEYQWRTVFCVAGGLYFVTNLVYVTLATAEQADWNEPEDITSRKNREPQEEPMLHKV